ncbi:MAG: acyl carrier protein [Candidatus Omnitrophica bacterium]|nr:acyl carrier protein [Candidatus Omnitrophota bacterium]
MVVLKKLDQDTKAEIKELISEVIEIPVDKFTDTCKFVEDLGVDSMMALEIVAAIEKKYKIRFQDEEIPKIQELSNIFEFMEQAIKKHG